MGNMTLGTVTARVEVGNPEWAGVMEGGQGEQQVTGTVHLPQGGSRESNAAVIGGTAFGSSEPATGIITEATTMIESQFSSLVEGAIGDGDLDGAAERVTALSTFLTNLLQSRLSVYLSECENGDEVAGTMMVIEGSYVVVEANFDASGLEEQIAAMISSALGGGS